MSLHDDYARMTPYEIAFPDPERVEALVDDVIEEASSRGVDPGLPGIFITLGSVGDFLQELQAPDAPEDAVLPYGALLFQAVHWLRAGRPLYLLETATTRRLVEGAPRGEPRPPASAGYVQLSQHLVWMSGAGGRAPESVDGLFWVASEQGSLHVLPITGVLPDPPGFTALPLPEAPLVDAGAWLTADMREGGQDYSSALPGHDLDRLYSVETAGEIFKLLGRFFAYVESTPGAREDRPGRDGASALEKPIDGPRPSALPYTRIRLSG